MKAIQMLMVGGMAMMCACQPSQQSKMYTVTGELDDSTHHGKKIYVMRYDDNKMIDSTFRSSCNQRISVYARRYGYDHRRTYRRWQDRPLRPHRCGNPRLPLLPLRYRIRTMGYAP